MLNKTIKKIRIIYRRELVGYFYSPLAYIFIIIFLLLTGFFTFAASPFGNFLNTNKADLSNSFFAYQPWLYLVLIPPIAMRLWAEELKSGTIELLFTMPVTVTEAVIGKFLAALSIIGCSLLLTFPYVVTVNWLGNPDNGIIIAGYLGSLLLAGSYLAIGCMTSSITKNQIISFILSVVICLILTLAGHPSVTDFFTNWAPVWVSNILGRLSVFPHFNLMQKGIIRFSDVLYFVSIIIFALFATCILLKIRNRAKSNQFISIMGIFVFLVILVNFNFLADKIPLRYDITQDKLYTLSESTTDILKNLTQPVTIRFYGTQGGEMPIPLRLYAKRIEDLLKEYVRTSQGKIVLEQYNPLPDSDAETSAGIDAIKVQSLGNGNNIYLGLTVSNLNHNSTIGFLSPSNEQTLEYNITHAIYDATHPQKPTVGVISSISVMESTSGYISSMHKQKPPWIFIQELQKNFNVQKISYDTNHINKEIDVLLIIHPKDLSIETEFAIDQYLLNGGKLLIFVDPYCFAASVSAPKSYFTQETPLPSASSLPHLFSAWGVQFSKPDEVVIAPNNAYHALNDPLGKEHPAILNLASDLMAQKDIIMTGLNKINLVFAGAFSGTPISSLSKTVLLKTTPYTELFSNFSYKIPTSHIDKDFHSINKPLDLMIRLSGNFQTAFPKGWPGQNSKSRSKHKRDKNTLTQSIKPSSAVLVGDVDMLFNSFCVAKQKVYDKTIIDVINSNLGFVENAAYQLSGDLNIINIRTRGTVERNFSKIENFYNKAKKKYQSKITLLENQLRHTEEYLNQIQSAKSQDQQLVLTEKQLNAVQKFRKNEKKIKKELTEIRKRLRDEIYSLKLKIEIANIALIPLLLIIFGIILSLVKRKRV